MDEFIFINEAQLEEIIKNKKPPVLLGNGFSIQFNDHFKYENLLTEIKDKWYPDTLIISLLQIKKDLNNNKYTTFEDLWLKIQRSSNSIFKENLLAPILNIHRKLAIAEISTRLQKFARWVSRFNHIYTLNYDLLLQWMLQERADTCKYNFNIGIDKTEDLPQNVFYLHGALHLFYSLDKDGILFLTTEAKDRKEMINMIVNQRRDTNNQFFEVFGGTHQEKDYYIRKNDYLSECRSSLENENSDTLIIYGCSMNENDSHIWNILAEHSSIRNIYISIYPNSDPDDKNKQKIIDTLQKQTGKPQIYFFNSDLSKLS